MKRSRLEWLKLIRDYPASPGVYLMRGEVGKIIYIGKANALRARLSSYFVPLHRNPKVHALVKHIRHIDYIVVSTPLEALVLEQDLIKQYRPKYNQALKDDKTYPYLMLTDEPFARLMMVRGSLHRFSARYPQATFLGPFPQAHKAQMTLEWLQRWLKMRTCKDYEFKHRSRPCLQYQIGWCDAPCVAYISAEAYQIKTHLVKQFLLKNHGPLKEELQQMMTHAAERLAFDEAIRYRDMLRFVEEAMTTDYVRRHALWIDVWGATIWQNKYLIGLLKLKDGVVDEMRFFEPMHMGSDEDWDSALSAYYHALMPEDLPRVIRVLEPMQVGCFASWYERVCKRSMGRMARAHLNKWADMLQSNLAQQVQRLNVAHGVLPLQDYAAFCEAMGLDESAWIVALDNSHISGNFTVGAMASFRAGVHDPATNRSYALSPQVPGDDVETMGLLMKKLSSYFKRLKRWPDVMVIDGGLAQCKVVQQACQTALTAVKLFAVSKGAKRIWGEETVHYAEHHLAAPALLDWPQPVFYTLLRIRDASHHLANQSHQKIRQRAQWKEGDKDDP